MRKTSPNLFKVSEVKLIYKSKIKASKRYQVRRSRDCYYLLTSFCYDLSTIEYRESFKVVLLNNASKVLGVTTLSEGGCDRTIIDIKQVAQACLLANATQAIISHNHPCGTLQPSIDDDMITDKLKKALQVLDIRLIDHIIVSPQGKSYYSYSDEGKL